MMMKVISILCALALLACTAVYEKEPNDTIKNSNKIFIDSKELKFITSPFALPFDKDSLDSGLLDGQQIRIEKNINKSKTDDSNWHYYIKGSKIEIHGNFYKSEDRDCFHILSPPGFVSIQFKAVKGINGAIEIYDSETLELVKNIDDYRKSDEEVAPLQATNKNLTFCLYQGDRDPRLAAENIDYTAIVSFFSLKLPLAFLLENEPNDFMHQADVLRANQVIIGSYAPAINRKNTTKENLRREEDWYFVDYPEGQNGNLKFQLELTKVAGADPVMVLFDIQGNKLLTIDNRGLGEGEVSPVMNIAPGMGYYIKIFSKLIRSQPYSFYTLQTRFHGQSHNQEFETNDTLISANPLQGQQFALQGYLSYQGDIDFFSFHIDAKAKLLLGEIAFPDAITTPLAEIRNEQNEMLLQFRADDENRIVIPGVYLESGQYYLKIWSAMASFSESLPYHLQANLNKASQYGEREPNNGLDTANSFNWDSNMQKIGPGTLSSSNDKDYFQIRIPEQSRKRFSFKLVSQSRSPIDLAITDRQGFILKQETKKPGQELDMVETIDGMGYIIISSPSGKQSDTGSNYFIHLVVQ